MSESNVIVPPTDLPEPAVPTVAAIDIGSNSIKMTVARREPDGSIRDLGWRSEVVRLGAGIDQTGRLADDRVAAALAVLRRFAAEARELGATRLLGVATEATRVASNGRAFLDEIRRELGIEVMAIEGEREAELSFRGLAAAIDVGGDLLVADIGGGSTELIRAHDGEMAGAGSVPLGSGRLTDLLITTDPPTLEELRRSRRQATDIVRPLQERLGENQGAPIRLILVGGTGEYLGRMVPNPDRIGVVDVEHVLERLTTIRAEELATVLVIPEARARVLPAGVAIVAALIDLVTPAAIAVAQSGIRAGLLIEAFAEMGPATEASSR